LKHKKSEYITKNGSEEQKQKLRHGQAKVHTSYTMLKAKEKPFVVMGSPWKALSDDSRREILLLLKKKDMIPTEIAEHFDFTLPAVSSHPRILKDANLITEKNMARTGSMQ
jgi:predicted transcriptional regulator